MPSETADGSALGQPGPFTVPGRWTLRLVGVPLLALVYYVSGKLGLRLAVSNESVTTVWPPTGIALAALLVFGLRLWPGVFLGALLVNLTTSGSWPASIGIAAGNTLEAVVGSVLVDRYAHGSRAFERVRDVFRFTLLAAVFSTMLSATFGVASLAATGSLVSDYRPVWLTWWLGDLGGDLLVAPFLILWSSWRMPVWNLRRILEGSLLLACLFGLSTAVFSDLLPFSPKNYAIGFLCIPVVLWSSFRFGPRNTSAILVLLSAVALWGTFRHFGAFSRDSKIEMLVFLQAFLGVISITGLAAAAAVVERSRASEELARRLEEVARLNAQLDAQKQDLAIYHSLLSHDISNIAMALLALIERIQLQADGPLTPAQEGLILRLNRQALELSRMSDNARTLLRLRERELPASDGALPVRWVLDQAVGRVRDLHFDRPFDCEVECPEGAMLAGMPLLDSVLVNLLDNAVRHNPKDSKPMIRIRVQPCAGSLTLEIQGGVPPPRESIAQLLQREVQTHRLSRHGIGLLLVREIIRRARGTIAARTVSSNGTEVFEVSVSLPSAAAWREPPDGKEDSMAARPGFSGGSGGRNPC